MPVICNEDKGTQKEKQNGNWMLQLETDMGFQLTIEKIIMQA